MATSNSKETMYAANFLTLSFTITNQDAAGAALDLTNLTLKWALVKGTASSYTKAPVLEKTEGSGITVTNPTGGLCEVDIDTADTSNSGTVKPGDYYWELEATDTQSESEVLATGELTILLNVENT